ncbi:hypothetical protein E2C01_094265 [Portunus trituberculatus]|uniref:Uncharacterized protein n=1 Tax=Portunus trituberculatus TaxID=210409 RepID=A0A5B7JVP5_PORTR|nr:hypothetical protein [Portunus trituberculatus]
MMQFSTVSSAGAIWCLGRDPIAVQRRV